MIRFENEICSYLQLPSIPKKKWDGKSSFNVGVAVLRMALGDLGYAVCTFDAESDAQPRVKKCFAVEPFRSIEEIYIVPNYMEVDVENADLDDESKKAAMRLAEEAKELSNEAEDEGMKEMKELPEYFFDFIHNDEEGRAYIQSYNSRNKIRGKIPTTHDGIVTRLAVIYSDRPQK